MIGTRFFSTKGIYSFRKANIQKRNDIEKLKQEATSLDEEIVTLSGVKSRALAAASSNEE